MASSGIGAWLVGRPSSAVCRDVVWALAAVCYSVLRGARVWRSLIGSSWFFGLGLAASVWLTVCRVPCGHPVAVWRVQLWRGVEWWVLGCSVGVGVRGVAEWCGSSYISFIVLEEQVFRCWSLRAVLALAAICVTPMRKWCED